MTKITPVIIGVRPSKLLSGEVGLFALRHLKKGTVINKEFNGGEEFFTKDAYKKLDVVTKRVVNAFGTRVYDGFYIIPNMNYMPISWFANHSCDPNAGFDKKLNIALIKNVKSGDEIFHDYGFSITDPDFVLHCKCGSKNCRKIITGNDWKNPEYFKKNKAYMNV